MGSTAIMFKLGFSVLVGGEMNYKVVILAQQLI